MARETVREIAERQGIDFLTLPETETIRILDEFSGDFQEDEDLVSDWYYQASPDQLRLFKREWRSWVKEIKENREFMRLAREAAKRMEANK